VPPEDDVQSYVDALCKRFPDTTLLLSGYQIVGQDIQVSNNTVIINQIKDLIDLLEDLKYAST
jgi:hypothetical protein